MAGLLHRDPLTSTAPSILFLFLPGSRRIQYTYSPLVIHFVAITSTSHTLPSTRSQALHALTPRTRHPLTWTPITLFYGNLFRPNRRKHHPILPSSANPYQSRSPRRLQSTLHMASNSNFHAHTVAQLALPRRMGQMKFCSMESRT